MSLKIQHPQPSAATGLTHESHATSASAHRRSEHLTVDAFSPVNENGSFEFDRVLKCGEVLRKSKHKHSFKASWKPSYMVLRPNLLSVYKKADESKLQLAVAVPDISAVALVKSPKSKRPNVFGIFTTEKNYRFQASSAEDADLWVDRIRNECSATNPDTTLVSDQPDNAVPEESADETDEHETRRVSGLSSVRPIDISRARRSLQSPDYIGNDVTSCSDLSDVPGQPASFQSASSFRRQSQEPSNRPAMRNGRASIRRDASQHSDLGSTHLDSERVILQGYLQCLKNIKGMRQWKRLWVVLRSHNLYFYKTEQEYSAIKIVPMEQIISAAELDPISRSKRFCFQVIAEDKPYRFCAPDEEAVDKWLGSLTSVLIKFHGGAPNPVPGAPLGAE